MITNEAIAGVFMERYENRDMESRLDKDRFKGLYKEAVKDFYTTVYFNTEEMYEEKSRECDENEKGYYRFEPCKWGAIVTPESPLFEKIQDYLKENSLSIHSDILEKMAVLSREAAVWYEEHELDFEDAFRQERMQLRLWLAEAFGELRREGFWNIQGNTDIYVLPFRGDCDIDYEEMVRTFHEMDQTCHGTEFLDYLAKEQGE